MSIILNIVLYIISLSLYIYRYIHICCVLPSLVLARDPRVSSSPPLSKPLCSDVSKARVGSSAATLSCALRFRMSCLYMFGAPRVYLNLDPGIQTPGLKC